MLIFLVGFMGSGKSTIGRLVAKSLDIDFFDMDDVIQDQEAMSISDIFESFGEDHFRILERDLIVGLEDLLQGDAVIATGGGAPCHFDNMGTLNKIGSTFYLQLTPGALLDRLKDEADDRPLLAGKSKAEMAKVIQDMYENRAPHYDKSLHTVESNRTPEEIVSEIMYLINE